ncbi:MAG: ELWxxDGT repeat protein [Spirulina sp.]
MTSLSLALQPLGIRSGAGAAIVPLSRISNFTLPAVGAWPAALTDSNGILYFTADDGTHGMELWKSDGTAAGTVLVKDIYRGSGYSSPAYLTNVNGTLFFTADNGFHGIELWKSDGTEAGTVLVKDIYSDSYFSPPSYFTPPPAHLTNLNGTLFFRAYSTTNGTELWKSDGTEAGTVLVKDIVAKGSSNPYVLTAVNDTLFFTADNGANGRELWKSDGTATGTALVKDLWDGPYGSNPKGLIDVNGTLFFSTTERNGLWKSDGTEVGTVLVKHLALQTGSSSAKTLADINGTLFFTANEGIHGSELWKSDGTATGTGLVKDVFSGSDAALPSSLTNVNGTLFFTAIDGIHGAELWKSDGTETGTVLVKDVLPGSGSADVANLTNVNGTLYFTADDGIHGVELWKSDGTEAGTVLVADVNPGSGSANPYELRLLGTNTLLFFADDGVNGVELYNLRVNTPPTGRVTIGGTATQGQTLTASNDFTDLDGISDPIVYQWQANGTDITGATGKTLLLTLSQVGQVITVIARYTDGFGTPEAVVSAPTSAVTAIPSPAPNPAQIIPLANQLLAVTGDSATRLTATVTTQGADSVVDIVVVVVDDAEGRIDGLLPSTTGYTAAAVQRATTLMSVLKAGDFAGQFGRRSLPIAPGQFLQFALIQGGTLDDLKRGGASQIFFATGAANANGQSVMQYRALDQGYLADLTLPGTASPSVTIQLGLDPTPAPVGSPRQGNLIQGELIDLTGMNGPTAKLTMDVFREAFYNNVVGLYTVQNAQGQVRDPLTGNLINPGEVGYVQAALANRVVSNLAGQNGQTLTYTAEVATGQLLSTFLIVDSSLDALLDEDSSNNPTVFFNHMGANDDGQDHVRLLSDNVFGFEDIAGGGDRDFNDVMVKISVI